MGTGGSIILTFSSPIREMDAATSLIKNRLLRHLKVNTSSDGNGSLWITTEEKLRLNEVFLKLTKSVKLELVPFDD